MLNDKHFARVVAGVAWKSDIGGQVVFLTSRDHIPLQLTFPLARFCFATNRLLSATKSSAAAAAGRGCGSPKT